MKGNQKHFKCSNLACAFLEEGNERIAKGVADKNMNEIEATQKTIELAQEKQKKTKHELETVHKEKKTKQMNLRKKLLKWQKVNESVFK